jgi:sugar phosphate isomerase/epimerase
MKAGGASIVTILSNPSLQLYSVRDALAADFAGTMQRVADIGYRRVEPYNFVEYADQLLAAFAATGIAAPSAHAGLLRTDEAGQRTIFETAGRLGIGIVIDPMVDPLRWTNAADVAAIADQLNAAAAVAAQFGIAVGYHNHHFELENRIDGRHALEVLADSLDDAVVLEIDTYWAHAGGADPVALLGRLGERVVAIHIKDGDGSLDPQNQVAVGSGTLPIREIIAGATQLRVGVVELDDTRGDMLGAVADSYTYLTGGNAQ